METELILQKNEESLIAGGSVQMQPIGKGIDFIDNFAQLAQEYADEIRLMQVPLELADLSQNGGELFV